MTVHISALALAIILAACSADAPDNVVAPVTATREAEVATPPAPIPSTDWSGFGNGSRSVVRMSGRAVPALFLCNATDQPMSVAMTVPADDTATLVRLDETSGRIGTTAVTIGAPDAGAGQIYYPLTADGRQVGTIHATNAGMLDGATTPTVSSLDVDGTRLRCRWQPETRFLGITARRAVLVTGPVDGPLVYRSFDYAKRADQVPADDGRTTRATLTVTGGERRGQTLLFRNGATEYRIRASGDAAAGPGTLEVFRTGRRIQAEPLLAYTLGATAESPPPRISAQFGCDDGSQVSVLFDNVADRAEISFANGRTATLAGQRPASGIWYAGGGYELRGKGDEVTITTPDGPRLCRAAR